MNLRTLFSLRPVDPLLERTLQSRARAPFEDDAIHLLTEISRRILASRICRAAPDLMALGYWLRPSNLNAIVSAATATGRQHRLRPRGLVLIVAPANVDLLFAYAWLLSVLAGNTSMVRVSQKDSPNRDALLGLIAEICGESRYARVLEDSWIVTYPHDSGITANLSAQCDARLIWGSDPTVRAIRNIELKPIAVERAFADRFSVAAFNARAIVQSEEPSLADLAGRFASDTLWAAQQACASPKCVYWVGTAEEVGQARGRFWPLFKAAASKFENSAASMMARINDLFAMAANASIAGLADELAAMPARAVGLLGGNSVRELHSGHGLFVEYTLDKLRDLAPHLRDKDQSLVIQGFGEGDVESLIECLPNRALDRIVPVGHATAFSIMWDGTDLFDILLRRVAITA